MKPTTLFLSAGLLALLPGHGDAAELKGVRLEMAKKQVHAVLSHVADYKSQDENQEVWMFRNDRSVRTLIVGYAADDRVRYVTELALKQGKALACKPLGDIKNAQVVGAAGNYIYTRSWKEHRDQFAAVARSEAGHLTSCSVKKVGVGIESEEAEHVGRASS